ncbi:leiomodin-3 isoform X2 [Syngnathoides biaculeatus]|uniref:leiomodin-3 isoform X2 n=1 Tax=Syngnathoides biaculeatus TaxID=300417 RepID=UPI002ADD7105|nr:leiomodin-3 isoform X2 [Syngnathoides biaculeatus]
MSSRENEDLNEEDIDEDELLAMLSPEELKELQSEMDIMIAPDDSVPVGQRQKDQTEKPPTGTFDHRSLVGYLYWEKESKRMLEEERVPATLLPSERTLREETEENAKVHTVEDGHDDEAQEVIEQILENKHKHGTREGEIIEEVTEAIVDEVKESKKTDEEIREKDKDLNPNTETASDTTEMENAERQDRTPGVKEESKIIDTFPPSDLPDDRKKSEPDDKLQQKEEKKINKLKIPKLALNNIKMTSRPSGNETNLESTLDKIRNNNSSVTEVNLNNIENIPKEMLLDYVNALKKNKHVKTFSIANTGVDENIAFNLANMLRENRSITTLNIESNFITGKGIVAIIRCLQFNETLTELRFHNQRHMLGHHAEMEISRLLKANNTLLKMGYHFEQPGPRMVVTNLLTRNLDRQRQLRKEEQKQQQLKEQREVMQMYESSLNLPPGLLEMLGYIPPLELLQKHGLVTPPKELNKKPPKEEQVETEEPAEAPRQVKHNKIPRQPGAEPQNPLKDVRLKKTPKKRDPFLELDRRDASRKERAGFQLRKTPKVKESVTQGTADERPNLKDVIKTLKPVPRRRVPPKVDPTPRDELLNEIKKSNVAYLKSVPLPKALESSETSLI